MPFCAQKDLLSFLSIYYIYNNLSIYYIYKKNPFFTFRMKSTSLLACRLLDVARFTTPPSPHRSVYIPLLRFSALNRCLSRYVHCPFFFFPILPCRFFFLQARLEAYICKYPRGIMNQGVVKPRRLSAGMTSRAGSG